MPKILPSSSESRNGEAVQGDAHDCRRERLGIALLDLDRIDSILKQKMVIPNIDPSQIIRVGSDRVDEVPAVVFNCNLLKAAMVCDILRSHDRKAGDPITNIYLKRDSWSRVPNSTVLTIMVDGKCRLNPEVFAAASAPVVKMAPTVVKLGGKKR